MTELQCHNWSDLCQLYDNDILDVVIVTYPELKPLFI